MSDHAIWQLINVPCVVRHSDPGAADEYGDHPVEMVTETNERCHFQQGTAGEADAIEHERWNIYFRPNVDIDANDQVVVAGMTLEVEGNPWRVVDPLTTWETHIEAKAIRRI
jgi:hypothetical protein